MFFSQVIGKSNASLYWQGTSVKKILQNPHYVGDLVQGREATLNVTNKKRGFLKEEDWVVVQNTHEPIILREIFEEAKHLLAMRARRGMVELKRKNTFLLILLIALIVERICGIAQTEKDTFVSPMQGTGTSLVPITQVAAFRSRKKPTSKTDGGKLLSE